MENRQRIVLPTDSLRLSRRRFVTGVTAGGALDIKELGVNNKDMDFANLQDMARTAVALQYKFPLPLLS
ncbi:MAG: hypothetical protein IH912_07300, partial [Proteobacteria bacterium]|nr:hypothetical protein [Pseudomonadota bacterium]